MTLMKRALIFDFGGVIMKTRDHSPRLAWDERLGLSPGSRGVLLGGVPGVSPGSVEAVVHGSDSWRKAQTGELSLDAYWDSVARDLKLNADQVRRLAQDFYSGDEVDTGVTDLIRQWRAEGHPLALLSNDSPALTEKLKSLNLDSLFDVVVISGLIGVMKPDARAYQAVLNHLQRPPETCIFIDDMPANVAGAEAVGLHGLHYRDGMNLRAALAPLLIMEHY